jgi:hypothetical protein
MTLITGQSRPFALCITLLLSVTLSALIASCGGGGGGSSSDSDSPNDPGDVSLNVETSQMDTGDNTRVTAEIQNINASGVILKFHYPTALKYVSGSAVLFSGQDEEVQIQPVDEAVLKKQRYLVFFLYPSSAINDSYVSISFDLKAIKSNPDAYVEVDLDNNDPAIRDSQEFNPENPRFSALEKWDVEIVGESTDPTPTPAPTRTPRS